VNNKARVSLSMNSHTRT